ncbi:MAG: EutN/CcmL family microcompartment protein [Candidatus Eisenbacteria bacterium]
MILGRVIGQMVSTVRHASLGRRKLLVVQPVTPEGAADGETFFAVDTVDAGRGDRVLVTQEGHAAEAIFGSAGIPVRSLIVGVVDAVEIGGAASPQERATP